MPNEIYKTSLSISILRKGVFVPVNVQIDDVEYNDGEPVSALLGSATVEENTLDIEGIDLAFSKDDEIVLNDIERGELTVMALRANRSLAAEDQAEDKE